MMKNLSVLDRRTLLRALSLAPLAAAVPSHILAEVARLNLISTDTCLLQPELTEGPFYIDPKLVRSDITEGRRGLPMQLRLQVVGPDCTPVAGARVDVWHCDADGAYSGVNNLGEGPDTTGETFLRGTQIADAEGIATFQTIFPGWYPGRATHIHYKVFVDDTAYLTSQIFFDETVNTSIYEDHEAYAAKGVVRAVVNANDRIAAEAGAGAYARVRMTEPDGIMEAAMVVGTGTTAPSGGVLGWLWGKA